MSVGTALRNLSLGLATASFLATGAAFAESSGLTGATARLDHTLNAQSARQGQRVEAKLDGSVKTRSGLDLPKGTELIGTVSAVKPSENGGPSNLSVTFTKAETKDGHMIPVRVTLIGAYPASAGGGTYGQQTMGPVPNHISADRKVDQEAGLLSHISMWSSAQAQKSATFRDQDGNVKLRQGTYFQLGIAPASTGSGMNAGA